MNSGQGVISCFFIIIALNALHLAMSLYEPLYVTKSPMEEKYYLIFDVKRDSPNGPCVIRSPDPEDDILLACPKADYPDALEILGGVGKMANVVDFCQMSIESHVFMSKDKKKNSVIGFLISTPNKQPSNPFKDVPENHSVCGLIYFKFDYKLNRIRSVRYTLTAGKLLTSEINEDRNVEYQKNINIFKYDIDNLYALSSLSLTKVQLAPEEDFLFASWKSASRHNIQTAPMWTELLPQWQALETFIRKVTQVIDSIKVITGAFGTIAYPGTTEDIYLHDELQLVPKFFWKALYIEIGSSIHQNHYRGIIFVMHNNHPDYNNPYEGQICSEQDVIANTGWTFYPNDQMKTLMYGCSLNAKNMKVFHEKMPSNVVYQPFKLGNVPVEVTNGEGRVIKIGTVDVLKEM